MQETATAAEGSVYSALALKPEASALVPASATQRSVRTPNYKWKKLKNLKFPQTGDKG